MSALTKSIDLAEATITEFESLLGNLRDEASNMKLEKLSDLLNEAVEAAFKLGVILRDAGTESERVE